ncbi:MAG TPA: aminoglycoside phosphotransferase family protein [Gaiella sp.]
MSPLAETAREVAAEWGIELGAPFPLARFSFVAAAGTDAVLKVTPRWDDEADHEADALRLWAGDGAVPLLRHDRERRALLLGRARPGEDIGALGEDEAIAIAVTVGRRLWQPADAPFRWVGDHVPRWLDRPEDGPGSRLIPTARRLLADLEMGATTLVHGDFHHHNVLSSAGGYVAIDPKPMLGEPEYDVASFLWNPIGHRMRRDVTERRLAAFASAGLDEARMRAWAVIRGSYLGADDDEVDVLRALV